MGIWNSFMRRWLGREPFDEVDGPAPYYTPSNQLPPMPVQGGASAHTKSGSRAPGAQPASASHFTLDSAMELMRTLPLDEDEELVLRVLRKTLTSTGVSLPDIVEAAVTREGELSATMTADRAAIQQLTNQIAALHAKIEEVGGVLNETMRVRELLEGALESETALMLALTPEMIAEMNGATADAQLAASPQAGAPAAPKAPPPSTAMRAVGAPVAVSGPPPPPKPVAISFPPIPKAASLPPALPVRKPLTQKPPPGIPSFSGGSTSTTTDTSSLPSLVDDKPSPKPANAAPPSEPESSGDLASKTIDAAAGDPPEKEKLRTTAPDESEVNRDWT